MTPLSEFPDIQSATELKYNQKNTIQLLNTNEESSKNVNSAEKK